MTLEEKGKLLKLMVFVKGGQKLQGNYFQWPNEVTEGKRKQMETQKYIYWWTEESI